MVLTQTVVSTATSLEDVLTVNERGYEHTPTRADPPADRTPATPEPTPTKPLGPDQGQGATTLPVKPRPPPK